MSVVDRLLGRLSGVAPTTAPPPAMRQVRHLPDYSAGMDQPLVMLTPKDPWTIRDSFEGTQIFGEPGSGKTTGSGAALAKAMLRAGYGGLVLTAKPDECALWQRYASEIGRTNSLLIVHPRHQWRFNFLDYEFSRPGEGAGFSENVVELFMNVIGAIESDGRQANEKFWDNNARRLLKHTLELIAAAGDVPTMTRIMDVIDSAPWENPDTQEMRRRSGSYCDACLTKARERGAPQLATLERYWLGQWARQPHKTRAGIEATLTGMADPFLSGMASELFSTTTNFVPEWSHLGAVIVIDLSEAEWFQAGRRAQLLFKYIWQRAVMRRKGMPRGHRPVFLFVDEAQTFTTPLDAQFQAMARSSCAATVYLTQNISNYLAIMEPQRGQAQTNSLLANLGTKIFHRNTDHRTNQWAADAIGKGTLIRYSGGGSRSLGRSAQNSSGRGKSYGPSNEMLMWGPSTVSTQHGYSDGINSSQSENTGWREEVDYLIQPQAFTALSGGGPQSRWIVQSIVLKGGKRFAYTGLPVTGAAFLQDGR